MTSSSVCAITVATVLVLLVTTPHIASAITCDDVYSPVIPCASYALNGRGSPSTSCCSGVRSLNSRLATRADRQTACNCLKNLAKSVRSFNAAAVAGLPGRCGVNVPFAISTSTDCSTVH